MVVLDDYRMVKHVCRHGDASKVILHSANSAYDDIEVARDKIRRLYLVEAVMNLKIRC